MSKIKVLVVIANPWNTSPLRLGSEDRAIQQAIRRNRYRNKIELIRCHAATIHDLRQALLDDEFQITHISGHGIDRGLVLEDDRGNEHIVPQKALASLFKVYSPLLVTLAHQGAAAYREKKAKLTLVRVEIIPSYLKELICRI